MKLSLKSNGIGPAGAAALAEMLKLNASLVRLELGINCIGNKGAIAFANALEINATIASLGLVDNDIDSEGAMAFLKVLKEGNSALTKLDLDRNVDISTRTELAETLASRRVLVFVRLHQPLEERVTPFVVQAMRRCSAHTTRQAGFVYHLVRTIYHNEVFQKPLRVDAGSARSSKRSICWFAEEEDPPERKSFRKVFEVTGTKIDNARQRDSKSLDVPDETAPNNAVIYKSIAAKSHFACHPAMDAGYQ
jgi:Leucine Rich repeat